MVIIITNPCLVLLFLLSGTLVSKFHFQLTKKAREKSRKRSDIVQFGRWRDSSASCLYSDRARSFNQWQRALYANFIINEFNKYKLQGRES